MNRITISGKVENTPEFSHKTFNENFYTFFLSSLRISGTADIIKCIAPEIVVTNIAENDNVIISGEIRTRNEYDANGKRKLIVYLFCKDIQPYSDCDVNSVEIYGFTCKTVPYRETPLGREIADTIIACNRTNSDKSDYIPCIVWGRNARRFANLEVGEKIHALGRLQSREYVKKLDDETEQTMIAYELSLSQFEKINKEA